MYVMVQSVMVPSADVSDSSDVINNANVPPTTASCSADMTVRIWNFDTFDCTKTLRGG